jgi:hypothetical protein
MNRILPAALLSALCVPVFAANVGVSVTAGQPGFYGQLDIGGVPTPQLVYPQPVVIQRAPEYAAAAPIYLHVPPGHEKHWHKHCAEYNACGRPVYFVSDDWYNKQYVPHYQNQHGDHGEHGDHGH